MKRIWLLLLVLAFSTISSANTASADEWWDDRWESRIPVYVVENTGLAQHQALIEVEIDTYSLIGNITMQADCDDIRVIERSTGTLLNHDVTNCDTTRTKIKFRATVPANHNSILALVYYNNFGAESVETTVSSWNQKASMSRGRLDSASAVYNNSIYVIGGSDTFLQNIYNLNEMYTPSTNSWTLKANIPEKIASLAAATLGNRIYVAGGFKIIPSQTLGMTVSEGTSALYSYVPTSDGWGSKANMSAARSHLVLEAVGGKLYAIGGYDHSAAVALKSNEEYDPETNTWTKKADMPIARYGMASAVVGGKIYVIGGIWGNGTAAEKTEVYDPKENTWTARANLPVAGRDCRAVVLNEKIHVLCGGIKTVYVYDSAGNSWSTGEDRPITTSGFAAEVVNGKVYTAGGGSGGSLLSRTDEYSVPNTGLNVSVVLSAREVCDNFDNDGDGSTDEGGVCNTVDNCGSFRYSCYTSDVTNATCKNATCTILECEKDYYDIDMDVENGCEYGCTITNNGTEIIDNIDNDCDGMVDFVEEDGDNDGFTVSGGDCNDKDPAVYPNATEKCDKVDNDCDKIINEGCPAGTSIFDQTLATSYDVGNGVCEPGEDQDNAPVDCGCPQGLTLDGNTCRAPEDITEDFIAKDDYCDKEKGETKENSPEDCKTPMGGIIAVILTIVGIGALIYYAYEHYPRTRLDDLAEKHEVASPEAPTSSLQGYVDYCLSKGFPKNQIRDALLKRGWDEDKVDGVLE